ncbi:MULTISPECIES: hypothetical protein [Mycobacteriaceae]|uniref:hypothetical protein n=1 Tax=Mycobacteriaceae TaxID=1762 RepID=UPI000993169B|nr:MULTISPECIES: hypothetical protein [Mycobacteriaceae]MDO3058506.1 hypothetical protein [Mycobacteroides abscessus subsp. abscessus]MDO3277958.1 hypothetical protein [Mycobacteroides abscessus subsp. abscessus]
MKTHPHNRSDCPAAFPIRDEHDYECTRDYLHSGSHMASTGSHVVAIWDGELAWCTSEHEGEKWFGNTGREWVEVAE